MRLVLDTNLYIRAMLTPGTTHEFLFFAFQKHQLFTHIIQIRELERVGNYPRIARRISSRTLSFFIQRLISHATLWQKNLNILPVCADASDDYLLALAIAVHTDFLLTEDERLFTLNSHKGVQIMRLYEFLKKYPLPDEKWTPG